MSYLPLFEQVIQHIIAGAPEQPPSETIAEACLTAEKLARQEKPQYRFEQLQGDWRLCWITGTQKARDRTAKTLGAGRYIPKWVTISLTYTPDAATASEQRGTIGNGVQFGGLYLSLSGPAKFLPTKNILAFDFTRMTVRVFGVQLYRGFVRGGQASEAQFYEQPVGQLAFFAYFLISDAVIAARGRGGGLAIWGRI